MASGRGSWKDWKGHEPVIEHLKKGNTRRGEAGGERRESRLRREMEKRSFVLQNQAEKTRVKHKRGQATALKRHGERT